MRLTDLNPRWLGLHNFDPNSVYHIGVGFEDPTHREQRLAVLFDPPIDPAGLAAKYGWGLPFPDKTHWKRTGDTFETLTLTPSIDASAHGLWHGFITNGEVS